MLTETPRCGQKWQKSNSLAERGGGRCYSTKVAYKAWLRNKAKLYSLYPEARTYARVVSRAGLFGSGWVLAWVCRKFSGRFRACIQNLFVTFSETIFSYICCTHRGYFCEWSDCDFSSANSIYKHNCVLLFSARIKLTLFCVGHHGKEISTPWHCVEEIYHYARGSQTFAGMEPMKRLTIIYRAHNKFLKTKKNTDAKLAKSVFY